MDSSMGQCAISRPLVVVDTNWIRGKSRDATLTAPTGYDIVIPEVLLWEFATTKSRSDNKDPEGVWIKLHSFLSANTGRVFLGRHPGRCITLESKPGKLIESRDIIERVESRWLKTTHNISKSRWIDQTRLARNDSAMPYPVMKSQFIQFVSHLAESIASVRPDLVRSASDTSDNSVWMNEIRNPAAVCGICSYWNSKFRHSQWSGALSVFPDRHAAGRLARLYLWNIWARLRGIRDDNLYEDTLFAFQASYAGRIATSDNKLVEMISFVFPHRVVKTLL